MSSSWPKVSVVKDMDQCLLETPLGSILSIQCSILCSLHLSTPYLRLFVRSVGILRWKNFGVFLCAGRHCFAGRQNATAALPCHNFIKCCLPNPAPILNQVIHPIWKGGLKGSWPYIELLSNYDNIFPAFGRWTLVEPSARWAPIRSGPSSARIWSSSPFREQRYQQHCYFRLKIWYLRTDTGKWYLLTDRQFQKSFLDVDSDIH